MSRSLLFRAIVAIAFPICAAFPQVVDFPGPDLQLHPVGAFDGADLIVVWEAFRGEASDVLGARLRLNNQLLDSTPIVISGAERNQADPALAWLSPCFLCVWDDCRNHSFDIYAARMGTGGTVLDRQGIPVRCSGNAAQFPTVAAGDSDFFVIWQETPPDSASRVCGARVSVSGSVKDTVPIRLSQGVGRQCAPKLAYDRDNRNFGIVWEQHSQEDDSVRVFGVRVSAGGVLLDSQPIRFCLNASNQTAPSIAWYGGGEHVHGFLAVWQDDRTDTAAIYGTRLTGDFAVQDTPGRRLYGSALTQASPMIAEDHWYGDLVWDFMLVWQERQGNGFWGIRYGYVSEGQLLRAFGATTLDSSDLITPFYVHAAGSFSPVLAVDRAVFARESTSVCRFPADIEIEGVGPMPSVRAPSVQLVKVAPSVADRSCRVTWYTEHATPVRVQLVDALGRVAVERIQGLLESGVQGVVLDVGELPAGAYFARVIGTGVSGVARLVVRR